MIREIEPDYPRSSRRGWASASARWIGHGGGDAFDYLGVQDEALQGVAGNLLGRNRISENAC